MKKSILAFMAMIMAGCAATQTPARVIETPAEQEVADSTQEETPKYEYHDAYAQLDGEIYTAASVFDFYKFTDKDYMYQEAEDVVIGHVLSIDKGSNYNEVADEYCYPYTLGKFTVLKSLKGDLQEDGVYTYGRSGGIVTAEEHYAQSEDGGDKFSRMTGEEPDYIGQFPVDSNRIEVGKTYLMYIIKSPNFKQDTYAIFGYKGGLRELNELFPDDYGDVQVLNNFTEEWENMSDVIPEA